jgi:hypothetical protein
MSAPRKNKASPAQPTPDEIIEASASPAKAIQAISAAPRHEAKLPVALRAENGFEYHLDLERRVIEGILDPDVPDVFIEVPSPVKGIRRFLHTAFVKEIDVRGLE